MVEQMMSELDKGDNSMPDYNLPEDPVHLGLLLKFQRMKNQILKGKASIKGTGESLLPPDDLVPEPHRLHDLIRGFYKPKGWKCMLSYLATEKDENYGRQIEWIDKNNGRFQRIIMKPPAGSNDKRAAGDVDAARCAMEKKFPIGILENIGKGVNRSLGLGLIRRQDEDGNFIVEPIEIPEEYMHMPAPTASKRNYFSIRTKDEDTIKKILGGQKELEFGGIYQFAEETKVGDIVFFSFGGYNIPWEPGLRFICTVLEAPYGFGYDPNNKRYFKIKLKVELMLPRTVKREELVPYRNCYDIIFIGPMTKWEPNQANQLIPDDKAVTLVRALLDFFPEQESELNRIFGKDFISRAKGEAEILVPQMLKYGQRPEPSAEPQEESTADEWKPEIPRIVSSMLMDNMPISSMQALINMGKNIIITGPPGTGKTTIAENACREAVRLGYIFDYVLTTATADWTTFDTVGGYMPDGRGSVKFVEGVILQSIRKNAWLIIDEINRSEVDKAFGQVFTVLSNKPVVLPYDFAPGKPYRIEFSDALTSSFDHKRGIYYIGRNWRIIATMNTFDKNALFALSYAFMRRFAFVEVPIPEEKLLNSLIDKTSSNDTVRSFVKHIMKASPRPLGPALLKELAEYLERTGMEGAVTGLTALILPQLEGLPRNQLVEFYREVGVKLDGNLRQSLKKSISGFFDIGESHFITADNKIAQVLSAEVSENNEAAEVENDENK